MAIRAISTPLIRIDEPNNLLLLVTHYRPYDNFIYPIKVDSKVVTVLATTDIKGGFDLSFEGQLFKTMLKLEREIKKGDSDPFKVKQFGEIVDSATQLSSRESEERKTQEFLAKHVQKQQTYFQNSARGTN